MQRSESVAEYSRPIPMGVVLMVAVAIHLPLLLMELPLRSYDTNLHIFFASHYLHHWFNPWNTKWFGGFSQTTYPPLAQQWVAVLSHLFGLNLAYMAVQFVAVLLLAIGVYRFAELWVSPRAASYAALASILLSSESFLIYSAGQLPTTAAAPLYLNALPYLYEWMRYGRGRSFLKGLVLFTAAAAVHHVTLIFATPFFAFPVLALALMDRNHGPNAGTVGGILTRAVVITVFVVAAVGIVLLPFWIALIHNPVTQTPIPHASRANYILSPNWGLNYFIVPYGALILALPFIVLRGARVSRLRPLLFGFWICFLISLGGTTPVGKWLLGRAFEVLTYERFSYWTSLLSLPILGAIVVDLIDRFRLKALIPLALIGALTCSFAVAWSTFRPADAENFNVTPVAEWLSRDGHDAFRYVTLGFGNKLSRLSMETDAPSVDGESNSARSLPEMTKYGGADLTNAKYYHEAGLDSLRAMLHHASRYGLKWVIVRDSYYDPLLDFAGWRKVDHLEGGTITIWSKDGVPPATPLNQSQMPPRWQGIMWGTLPFGSSLLAILVVVFLPDKRRRQGDEEEDAPVTPIAHEHPIPGRMVS